MSQSFKIHKNIRSLKRVWLYDGYRKARKLRRHAKQIKWYVFALILIKYLCQSGIIQLSALIICVFSWYFQCFWSLHSSFLDKSLTALPMSWAGVGSVATVMASQHPWRSIGLLVWFITLEALCVVRGRVWFYTLFVCFSSLSVMTTDTLHSPLRVSVAWFALLAQYLDYPDDVIWIPSFLAPLLLLASNFRTFLEHVVVLADDAIVLLVQSADSSFSMRQRECPRSPIRLILWLICVNHPMNGACLCLILHFLVVCWV